MNKEEGFTVIEILVLVGILGIMAWMASLNLNDFSSNYQTSAATERLKQKLLYTRAEAVGRNTVVYLKKTGTNKFQIEWLDGATTKKIGPEFSISEKSDVSVALGSGFSAGDDRISFDRNGMITNISGTATMTVTDGHSSKDLNLYISGDVCEPSDKDKTN